jgi:Uma2 family endonuclease
VPPAAGPDRATFADLAALPDDAHAEIVHGVIVEKASPTMEHGRTQSGVVAFARPFDRRSGGDRGPAGWWIGTEVDVEFFAHEVFRHDAVGWRRDRVPECPSGRPVRVRPDWACEVLSRSNARRDLVDKFRVLKEAGVTHYWIADPEERILVVHRLESTGYLVVLTAGSGETVRAEPFDTVPLDLDDLFGAA